jgi:hypothetical protein
MKRSDINAALTCAEAVSRKVGVFLKGKLRAHKRINQQTAHDIKLELDDRSQRMIERQLLKVFPEVAILGEEGVVGDPDFEWRWVVDPIDGTVNFGRGLPHACVSIALQQRLPESKGHWDDYTTEIDCAINRINHPPPLKIRIPHHAFLTQDGHLRKYFEQLSLNHPLAAIIQLQLDIMRTLLINTLMGPQFTLEKHANLSGYSFGTC